MAHSSLGPEELSPHCCCPGGQVLKCSLSVPPSLPLPGLGLTLLQPEELTLLLIQLRSHQAKMAGVHGDALHHLHHNGFLGPSLQVRPPRILNPCSRPALQPHSNESWIPSPQTNPHHPQSVSLLVFWSQLHHSLDCVVCWSCLVVLVA